MSMSLFKESPSTPPLAGFSPNHFKYYNANLDKHQFNQILVNATLNLVKVLYPTSKVNVRFFVVEILKRSKTSSQTLQVCCYYLYKLIKRIQLGEDCALPPCPKKLLLGCLILASKFNQDHNYSLKSWLKICGCKEDGAVFNLQTLRTLEVQCLQLLNYELCLNGKKYENWCNILVIFAYDFIKFHQISNASSTIVWDDDAVSINVKLIKWCKFLTHMNDSLLKLVTISFGLYYNSQIGKKVQVEKKRWLDEDLPQPKRIRAM